MGSRSVATAPDGGRAVKGGEQTVVMATVLISAAAGSHNMTAWGQFVEIISKPDNMPVAGALLLVVFFTWVSLREALHNDRLIREKRKSEIIQDMQK